MIELWNLLALHAALGVSQPESKCSHRLCLPHELSPHAVRIPPAEGIPEWQGGGDCQPCTRRWELASQRAHARTGCACHTNYLRMPCAAPPAEGAPEWRGGRACQLRTRRCQSVSQQAHAFPFCVYRTRSTPECRDRKTCQSCTRRYTRLIGRWDCQPCTRRWESAGQRAHALTGCACRISYLHVPCAAPDWWNSGACQSCTRRWESVYQRANACT